MDDSQGICVLKSLSQYMSWIDEFEDMLSEEREIREFADKSVRIPTVVDDEITGHDTYSLESIQTRKSYSENRSADDIPGNSWGIHGKTAEESVPVDYDWFAKCTGTEPMMAGTILYGYFDTVDEVLVRNETSMGHRTASYYWIDKSEIEVL